MFASKCAPLRCGRKVVSSVMPSRARLCEPTTALVLPFHRGTFRGLTSEEKSGTDLHAFFQQQMMELQSERETLFGDSVEAVDDPTTMTQQKEPKVEEEPHDFEQDMEELHSEREALFGFSPEDRDAWGQGQSSHKISPELMQQIQAARNAQEQAESMQSSSQYTSPSARPEPTVDTSHDSFTHVSQDGKSVHMVDVGSKEVTTRMAQARTSVLLPPEVVEAFDLSLSTTNPELVGPKGPIFATAKLAGIMAAKKTSDLIPLCHPLPLDQVKVDIALQDDNRKVVITCTCRVTHKTGVEMEALTGASVAALTVYDMVKAVSHRVEITDTKLIAKTGGKRTVLDSEQQ